MISKVEFEEVMKERDYAAWLVKFRETGARPVLLVGLVPDDSAPYQAKIMISGPVDLAAQSVLGLLEQVAKGIWSTVIKAEDGKPLIHKAVEGAFTLTPPRPGEGPVTSPSTPPS
jgi:hypothetical protein